MLVVVSSHDVSRNWLVTILFGFLVCFLSLGTLYCLVVLSCTFLFFCFIAHVAGIVLSPLLGATFGILQIVIILGSLIFSTGLKRDTISSFLLFPDKFKLFLKRGLHTISFILLVSSCFRCFPVLNLAWGISGFALSRIPHSISAPRNRRPFLARAFLIALLTFSLLELGARSLLTVFPLPVDFFIPCQYDEDLIFRLKPQAEGTFIIKNNAGQTIHVEGRVSSQGIREREISEKTTNELRIVVVGDSYTMGHGLRPEETYARKLEDLLNQQHLPFRVTVVNCGIGGYAPWQERIFLAKYGFDFQPDIVLLQLFPPNDISGSYNRNGRLLPVIHERWEKKVYDFSHQFELPFMLEHMLKTYVVTYRLAAYAFQLNDPVRRTVSCCRLYPPTVYPSFHSLYSRPVLREACLDTWYPELYEAWRLYETAIKGIRDDCARRGIDLTAFVHGELISLKPEEWTRLNETFSKTPYEMNKDIRLTQQLLNTLDIPSADVLSCFESYTEKEDLYYIHDGHFSPTGATVIAHCLCDFFLHKYSWSAQSHP